MKKQIPGQVGKSKIQVIDKMYDWGVYVWKKSNGKWFTDGQGNILNIPSNKGDISKIAELKQAAAHYGEPDGEPVFFAGLNRITDEEYAEQKQRMSEGLIPNLNDLGAVHAAKQTIKKYGADD
jgi:superfamily I DNA/RNA helicase